MTKHLLTDTFKIRLTLDENNKGGKLVARGEFARGGVPTANRRVYSEALWNREINRLSEAMKSRQVMGEVDHPADGKTKLSRASHIITNLSVDKNGVVLGEAEIMNTEAGKTLKAILEAGGAIGVSSRGYGSVQVNEQGYDVVQDDFSLMTFDFVADPANATSYPTFTMEGKKAPEGEVMAEKKEQVANKLEEKNDNVVVWDNGGKTIDRYTVAVKDGGEWAIFTMSKEQGPQGVNLYSHSVKDLSELPDQGKMVSLSDLAPQVVKGIENRMSDDGMQEQRKLVGEAANMSEFVVKDSASGKQIGVVKAKDKEDAEKKAGRIYFMPKGSLEVVLKDEKIESSCEKKEEMAEKPEDKPEQKEMKDEPKEEPKDEIEAKVESLTLDQIKKSLAPLFTSEGADQLIAQKDKEIEEAKQQLESVQVHVQKLSHVCRDLGYSLFLERTLSRHPKYAQILESIGDLAKVDSLDELKSRIKMYESEANEYVLSVDQLVNQERVRVQEESKGKIEKLNKQIQNLSEEMKVLLDKNKSLSAEKNAALSEAKELSVRLYMEHKASSNPKGPMIRERFESLEVKSKEAVDSLIESCAVNLNESAEFSRIRARLRGRATPSNLVEESLKGTVRDQAEESIGIVNGLNLKVSEILALSGDKKTK